ncbi:uncharacterized protein LOC118153478 [Callithrix jacchus]
MRARKFHHAHQEGGCAGARTGRWAFRQPTACKDHGHPPGTGRVARGQASVPGVTQPAPPPAPGLGNPPPPRVQLRGPTAPPEGLPALLQTKRALRGRRGPESGDRRVAAMLARGGGDRVTEEYRPANKERVPARRPRPAPPVSPPRPGRHGAQCGRRPKDSALPGPPRAALTSAPGPAAAPLARPQPAPSHGHAGPTLAPRGPYLLAADATVHRPVPPSLVRALAGPSPSQKAPPRPRFLAAYATGSPAGRGAAHWARQTATAAPADCPRPTATAALGPGADFPDFPERTVPGAVAHACNPSTLGG